jgi:hypothetical protein
METVAFPLMLLLIIVNTLDLKRQATYLVTYQLEILILKTLINSVSLSNFYLYLNSFL